MFSKKSLMLVLSGFVLVAGGSWAQTVWAQTVQPGSSPLADQSEGVLAAYRSGADSRSDFKRIREFVIGAPPKWRQIAWIPDLWRGVEASQAQNKPMFLWAMNGDPLGCV